MQTFQAERRCELCQCRPGEKFFWSDLFPVDSLIDLVPVVGDLCVDCHLQMREMNRSILQSRGLLVSA